MNLLGWTFLLCLKLNLLLRSRRSDYGEFLRDAPPSVPAGGTTGGQGGEQNVPGSGTGDTANIPGTAPFGGGQGNGGGATDSQGQGAPGAADLMQQLEDQIDAFETEVTNIRAELRETKLNLRNAIRRNETDVIVIRTLNDKVVELNQRLQTATGGLNGTVLVSAMNRVSRATQDLMLERQGLQVLNVEARRVNPVDFP